MLSRNFRFHGYNSLNWVYANGATVRDPRISLRYKLNHKRANYRASVVVSRKVNKSAIVRNRIRRRIYEIIRLNLPKNSASYDLVFSVYSDQLADMETSELTALITGLLKNAKILL